MTEASTARIVIVVPAKLREQVSQLADRDEVSLSAISRRALKWYVREFAVSVDRRKP